jgi:hypothetical protein
MAGLTNVESEVGEPMTLPQSSSRRICGRDGRGRRESRLRNPFRLAEQTILDGLQWKPPSDARFLADIDIDADMGGVISIESKATMQIDDITFRNCLCGHKGHEASLDEKCGLAIYTQDPRTKPTRSCRFGCKSDDSGNLRVLTTKEKMS